MFGVCSTLIKQLHWKYTVLKSIGIYSCIQQLSAGIFQISGPEYKAPERKGYKGRHSNPYNEKGCKCNGEGVHEVQWKHRRRKSL